MRSRKWAVVTAALILGACRSESTPQVKPITVGWRHIETFSGHGNSLTESFNIESGQFRIKWETSHETAAGKGAFLVMVHSAVSGRPLLQAIEHKGVGHDTAYVNEDPRLFQLVIESNDLDWTLTVEEAVPSYSGTRHLSPNGHI